MAERGWFGSDTAPLLALTGLVLVLTSLLLPFVTLKKFGAERTALVGGGFEGLWSHGFSLLGVVLLFCGIVAPCGLLVLIVAISQTDDVERGRAWNRRFRWLAEKIECWAIPEVQVLGVMVAFLKLGDIVNVSIEPGFWCYGVASLFTLLAWRRLSLRLPSGQLSTDSDPVLSRHSTRLSRPASSVQAALLAISAAILLLPAYALPVMHLGIAGKAASDTTIFSGILQLWRQGLPGLALIVFTASFLVPLLKLAGLTWLLAAVWRKRIGRPRLLTRIYGVIDFIGRWSMLDVFLVAFLTGAVRFGAVASVQPRPGIAAFGAVVVLTMLATHRFDPRLLWAETEQPR